MFFNLSSSTMKLFAGQSADLVPVTVSEAKNSPLGIYGIVPDGT